MAGTPNATHLAAINGNLDLDGATIRVALYSDATAYTFDPVNHETVADVLDGGTTAAELAGSSGYTGSGDRKTLANVQTSQDNTDNEAVVDADDVSWTSVDATNQLQGYLIYKQVGGDDTTPGDDRLLVVVDDDMSDAPAGLPLPLNGSNVEITFDAEGIINQQTA